MKTVSVAGIEHFAAIPDLPERDASCLGRKTPCPEGEMLVPARGAPYPNAVRRVPTPERLVPNAVRRVPRVVRRFLSRCGVSRARCAIFGRGKPFYESDF